MRLPAFLRREAPNRATLTFMPDGRVVLGAPCDATQEQVHYAAIGLQDWMNEGRRVLVFPWPIDVVDQR